MFRKCYLPLCRRPSLTQRNQSQSQSQYRAVNFWFVSQDYCGLFCAFITWFVVLYVDFFTVHWILYPKIAGKHAELQKSQTGSPNVLLMMMNNIWVFHFIVFELLCVLALASHLRAMLSDPGTLPVLKYSKHNPAKQIWLQETQGMKTKPELVRYARKRRWCSRCEIFKPLGTHHCSICQRCVSQMDHHCPWINSCVGEANLRFFLQFLFHVMVASLYAICIMSYKGIEVLKSSERILPRRNGATRGRFVRNSDGRLVRVPSSLSRAGPGTNTFNSDPAKRSFASDAHDNMGSDSDPDSEFLWRLLSFLGIVFAFVLAVFFFVFVIAMSCDQYEFLVSGVAGIDARQDNFEELEKPRTLCQGLAETCGTESFSWKWFVPWESFKPGPRPPLYPPSHLQSPRHLDSTASDKSPGETTETNVYLYHKGEKETNSAQSGSSKTAEAAEEVDEISADAAHAAYGSKAELVNMDGLEQQTVRRRRPRGSGGGGEEEEKEGSGGREGRGGRGGKGRKK